MTGAPFPGIPRTGSYMEGQLLVATTRIVESPFSRAVLFVCAHSDEGAMGVIVNHHINELTLADVLKQLKIDASVPPKKHPVYLGGPVEAGRGLVIHSDDYRHPDTLVFERGIAATSNLQVLHDIADGKGPKKSLLALGYAAWSAGQLEAEVEANSWISVPATKELLFNTDDAAKWEESAGSLGVDMFKLSGEAGHA